MYDRNFPFIKLSIADPKTAERVISGLKDKVDIISASQAAMLVDDIIWGLSLETSFGSAIAEGYIDLIGAVKEDMLCMYGSFVRKFGEEGPTFGKIMAESLVPVIKYKGKRFTEKFLQAVDIMKKKGVYVLKSPLEALCKLLESKDTKSASAFVDLLCDTFSYDLSYNRCRHLSFILPKSVISFSSSKRYWQTEQLLRVIRMDPHLADVFLDGMEKGLYLLSKKNLAGFVSSGLRKYRRNKRLGIRFLSLETKDAADLFNNMQITVPFSHVQQSLNRYLQARIGVFISVRPISSMAGSFLNASKDKPLVCSDGKFIYLPDEIGLFSSKKKNIELYKCLAKLEAGYYEFDTFDFDLEKIKEKPYINDFVPEDNKNFLCDLELFFSLFPSPQLASDLFTIFEHGRLKVFFSQKYPGLLKQAMPMLYEEAVRIFKEGDVVESVFLLYCKIALDISPEDLQVKKSDTAKLSSIVSLFNQKCEEESSVEVCAELVAETYHHVEDIIGKTYQGGESQCYIPLKTPFGRRVRPDLFFAAHQKYETLAKRVEHILEKKGYKVYRSDIFKRVMENSGSLSLDDINEIIISRRAGHFEQNPAINLSMTDLPGIFGEKEDILPLVDDGSFPVYRYKEWDCTIKDYVHDHVRVQIKPVHGSDGIFYSDTLRRFSGLISKIRYSFEMLKPDGLKILRQWTEGDDFDYRALLDFAIDRKGGLTPSDRLYIKRIKQARDVAVLLLVDLSRSTSNKVFGSDKTVLDVEKEAIVLFCEALKVVGDRFSIAGFSGTGRLGVDYLCIKDFDEEISDDVKQRIGSLVPQRSTRMGAAVRHAASQLERATSRTRLLLIIGDGFPNDAGYKQEYAIEDTRMAINETRSKSIFAKAITVNLAQDPRLDDIYGDVHHNVISDVRELPDKLLQIYKQLTK